MQLNYTPEYTKTEFYCYWIDCNCGYKIKELLEEIALCQESYIFCNNCKTEFKITKQDKIKKVFYCKYIKTYG